MGRGKTDEEAKGGLGQQSGPCGDGKKERQWAAALWLGHLGESGVHSPEWEIKSWTWRD